MQIFFLFLLKDRGCINRTFSLPFAMICCYSILPFLIPLDSVVKYLLFPLAGAFALFFLYIARSEKEHFLSFLFYLLNGILLCILYSNIKAAFYGWRQIVSQDVWKKRAELLVCRRSSSLDGFMRDIGDVEL